MRKIVFEIAISLDGFIEGPNGELDWIIFDRTSEYVKELQSRFDTVFYGRLTYEKFGLPIEAHVDYPQLYNKSVIDMRKYVFSRTMKHMPGNGMMINGNLVWEIKRLQEEEGKDIWLCGGPDLLRTFIDHDFIDEYVLAVQPVVLGKGKPLFKDLKHRLNFRLIRSKALKSGVVMLNYRPEKSKSKAQRNGRSI